MHMELIKKIFFSFLTRPIKGPSLHEPVEGTRIVSIRKGTFLLGYKYIYELIKDRNNEWVWEKVGDFDERDMFDAFLISSEFCQKYKTRKNRNRFVLQEII